MFGFTEVKLGIIPAVISPFVLAKIGRSAARELFLTGARFSAARAREIGLVHAVVPAAELDATVDSYVDELLTAAPEAVAAAKALIPRRVRGAVRARRRRSRRRRSPHAACRPKARKGCARSSRSARRPGSLEG